MSEALAGSKKDVEQLVLEYSESRRPDLKDLIILQCSGMIERIARRFSGVEPFDDLVQVGYIGLLNALSKFDPANGVRFNTYATHLVAGEIKHYLRDRSQIIRHPAWVQELRQRLNKASVALQAELGRQPTIREIAEACSVSENAVEEVLATQDLLRVSSLDAPSSSDEDGESEIDKLDAIGPCQGQLGVEERVVLEAAISQLRDLERDVLTMFHFEMLSQTEIAAKLDISCNYVSHILRQSLNKLRKALVNEEEADRALRKDLPNEGDSLDTESRAYSEQYFINRLTEEIHRVVGTENSVAVISVQFSGLSSLQGFYGTNSVRDFLVDAAEFLRHSVRSLDVVCRYGTTGFGIILPDTGERATQVFQRLHRRFEQWMLGRFGNNGSIHADIGFATAPIDGRSVNEIVAKLAEGDATKKAA
ncbi:MAG: sigma-70 family RNA polymerase sigma factor [Armatimonadetes bacterium]|nr:sigma-70 family RNA polymerase sigma factor [Armatimonadota bacterium]